MSRTSRLVLPLLLLGLGAGCSQHPPTHPSPPPGTAAALANDPATVLLSAGTLRLDLDAGLATLEPDRQALAIGDTYSELGLAPAFNGDFGQNFRVVGLRRIGPTSIEVTFETKHPFSPALRPDLAIFNLKAWIVSSQNAVNLNGVDIAPGLVANATGYGRMWTDTALNQPGFPYATVQPYVMLNENRNNAPFDWQQPAGWNVFFPGMVSEDAVELELGTATQLNLRVYLTADYGQSAVRATRQNPEYSLPQFAGNAPWKVEVTEILNGLTDSQTASSAEFQVDIWDWKQGSGLGSDVASASLHIPGVMVAPTTLTLTGSGQDTDPLTASTIVLNTLGATEGDYWGLIEATDQATSGTGLLEDLRTPIAITQYRTWQVFPVTVLPDTFVVPPTAQIASCGFTSTIKALIDHPFDGSPSIPGDHPIVSYEWDFDYNGVVFDVMATGITAEYPYPAPGSYTVALRVSDGFGNSDIGTRPINIIGTPAWQTPVRLTTNALGEHFGEIPDGASTIAVGSDGTVHLLWGLVQFSGSFATEYWYSQLPVDACNGAGSWSTPQNFWTTPASNQITRKLALVVSPTNTVHALTVTRTGASLTTLQEHVRTGVTWSSPVSIMVAPDAFQPLTGAVMAQDPAGNLAVAALHRTAQPSCPGTPAVPWNIRFTRKVSGVWQPHQVIGTADLVVDIPACGNVGHMYGHALALEALADGEWVAVWDNLVTPFDGFTSQNTGNTKLVWTRTTSGSWAAPSNLYTSAAQYRHPILRRSPNGTLWLVAREGTGGTPPIGISRYQGGTWDASMGAVLPSGVGGTTYFSLNFDDAGRGLFVSCHQGVSWPLNSKRFQQSDTPAAIAALPLQLIEPTTSQRFPIQGVPVGDGRMVAVWTTLKYGGSPFSGFEIDTAIWQ